MQTNNMWKYMDVLIKQQIHLNLRKLEWSLFIFARELV